MTQGPVGAQGGLSSCVLQRRETTAQRPHWLAGAAGFEPWNVGKIRGAHRAIRRKLAPARVIATAAAVFGRSASAIPVRRRPILFAIGGGLAVSCGEPIADQVGQHINVEVVREQDPARDARKRHAPGTGSSLTLPFGPGEASRVHGGQDGSP
jgi:hypothetical protein